MKARKHDLIVLSYPKCGRTWLSYLYAYCAIYHLGLEPEGLSEFANKPTKSEFFLDRVCPRAAAHNFPIFRFEHPVALGRDDAGSAARWIQKSSRRPTIVLVRDPRDVVVSSFHHVTGRARHPGAYDFAPPTTLSEYVRDEHFGVRHVTGIFNQLARMMERRDDCLLIRYEELRASAVPVLRRCIRFAGSEVPEEDLQEATRLASFDHLRRLESRRLAAVGLPPTHDGRRIRRGIVGAHVDEMRSDDVVWCDAVLRSELAPALRAYYG
jgi:hypothetical protein